MDYKDQEKLINIEKQLDQACAILRTIWFLAFDANTPEKTILTNIKGVLSFNVKNPNDTKRKTDKL